MQLKTEYEAENELITSKQDSSEENKSVKRLIY